jgi:hypothetical protein
MEDQQQVVGSIPGGQMTKEQIKANEAKSHGASQVLADEFEPPKKKSKGKGKDKKQPKAKTAAKVQRSKANGIGALAKKMILSPKFKEWTNEKIAAEVRKAKKSHTTGSCIAWYKAKMRLDGELK